MSNHYEVPSWAGKPPQGLHLDVTKDEKLVQKLMIDEKKCYLFGRNPQLNDFQIDHTSCSRVHSAFVYHKHLNIAYLVDLGSTHGTFIGSKRLEAHKPTVLQIGSNFHFGASTRIYTLRERPTTNSRSNIMEDIPLSESADGTLLGLPETQDEIDNLTEYNTAHNRRISTLGIANDSSGYKKNAGLKRKRVTFNEDEIIINPEDVDPSIGRFRNLVQTTVVPTTTKKLKLDMNAVASSASMTFSLSSPTDLHKNILHPTILSPSLYAGLPPTAIDLDHPLHSHPSTSSSEEISLNPFGSKLGLLLPNPAPEITVIENPNPISAQSKSVQMQHTDEHPDDDEPRKRKKYAKEAWPKLARKNSFNIKTN